jgi:hypothetical protein
MKWSNMPLRKSITFLFLVMGLLGCERETYTTWSCSNSSGVKSAMILKKAQMQFQDHQFDYCGSLGPVSYFDLKCPAIIQESSKVFTPSTGTLVSGKNEFECNAL